MSSVFQITSSKSKLYSVDEFGVVNYKTRYVAMLCILSMATLILLLGCITYYAEVGTEGATIQSFGDALWLMIMSSTTIGFGSQYPVTIIGRVMVTMMFITGVGIIGGLGALVASKLLGFSDTNVKNRELRKQNAEILAMNKKLEQKLDLLVEKIEPMVSNNKND
ncbi:potassium channel family protein [Thalassotalea sp. PP2-459]|uniref:potassium channel family protein n=1 Tax=Thalassotalea sp. PP2-459 TaxID=1742724 RepID=UPI0009435C89|nr:potassium channel family protein [Thalassotalea sp. PP2-459]OKY25061.1 voltage-gated potassium channel [Thalassotalea sp. PP2-459]